MTLGLLPPTYMYSPVMRENVLQTLCWPTQSTGSGVHGVVGAAVHEPVVVVCEHAHVSAIPLSESWVMTELRREGGREGGGGEGRGRVAAPGQMVQFHIVQYKFVEVVSTSSCLVYSY